MAEQQYRDLGVDGLFFGPPSAGVGGVLRLKLLHRSYRAVEQACHLAPAFLVEPETQASDLRIRLVEPARDASGSGIGHDAAKLSRERVPPQAGRQARPLLGIEPRIHESAVTMLERAAPLPRADELDATEPFEDSNVVRDSAYGRVKAARKLRRTRVCQLAQALEDALPQRVRQRLGEIRIQRPIPSGIRARLH